MNPPPDALRTAHRICPLCEACCGLELRLDGERVVSIRGHDGDVLSAGYVCPKAVALRDLHDDPDRVRQPLLRRGARLEPVGWDEAFDEIEQRLMPLVRAHGRDAVGLVLGNPIVHKLGLSLYVPRLVKALGTKNVFSASTLDQMPKHVSCGLMFGHPLSVPVPDIDRCDWLLVIGANPIVSNGSMWTVPGFRHRARALRARGGRLTVIDPRRTETAHAADAHHFIRPGGDVYLLAAMARTLFDEKLVRLGRLQPHVAGLDALREALAPFTPEFAQARSGIGADTVRRLARELAAAERGCVYGRIGTCTQPFGSAASWLVDVLNLLSGHLDESGGAMFPKAPALAGNTQGKPGVGRGLATGRHRSRVSGAPEVLGELPMGCLAEEIETPGDGQVRALITVAGNPVLSAPHGERLSRALDRLAFMVSVDIYVNETTRHADVILPGLSPLEEPHYDVAFPQLAHRNVARASKPVFDAPPGQEPEWRTLLRLAAIASGRGARADVLAWDDKLLTAEVGKHAGSHATAVLAALGAERGPARWLDLALRSGPYGDGFGLRPAGLTLQRMLRTPAGIDLGPLEPRLPEALRTPSGRIEAAPQSLLAELGRAAAQPPLSMPADALQIVGRRDVRSNNSWMHNLPVLAKGPQRFTLLMHPSDAASRALAEGDIARLRAGERTAHALVALSDDLMPGVVSLPHGWGHDLPGVQLRVAREQPGANLNALLDESMRDPLSGTSVLSGVAVTVERAPAGAGA